jgi:hypothetical protein
MKRSTDQGFDQQYKAQVAVEQASLLVVGHALSNHPNDQREAAPTVASIPPALGTPAAAALDNGYFGAPTVRALEAWGIVPYIATGRDPHHQGWQAYFAAAPAPPLPGAGLKERMAYTLKTDPGKAIYRLRKCTVEPVLGGSKEVLGFRQCSLRGLVAAAGEWCLVCLAWNLKRLHRLTVGEGRQFAKACRDARGLVQWGAREEACHGRTGPPLSTDVHSGRGGRVRADHPPAARATESGRAGEAGAAAARAARAGQRGGRAAAGQARELGALLAQGLGDGGFPPGGPGRARAQAHFFPLGRSPRSRRWPASCRRGVSSRSPATAPPTWRG